VDICVHGTAPILKCSKGLLFFGGEINVNMEDDITTYKLAGKQKIDHGSPGSI
jgi:hypothetical protein